MNIYYRNVHDSKGGKNMNQKIKAEDEKESTMCDNYVKTELN